MSARVIVVGSLNMDLVVRAARLPGPGETIIGNEYHEIPGGKGANQAVSAARLGAQVAMVGRVGTDAFANTLRQNLEVEGVDHTHVIQDAETSTGIALITVDDEGQNSIVIASGANMHLSPKDVEEAESAIAAADLLLLQLESPMHTVTRAAELAGSHGVRVTLNPAPARPLPSGLVSRVDTLIPNQSEAALLADRPIRNQPEAEQAARALLDRGVRSVVLTLGARGAVLAREGRTEHFPAFDLSPVDTTAAGDRVYWQRSRCSSRRQVAGGSSALGKRGRCARHYQAGRPIVSAKPQRSGVVIG